MAARHLLIKGRVQGVFYRGWTEQNARALGLSGWVRNLSNGAVEAVIAGPDEAVDEMIRRCRQGPPAARVEDIEIGETDENPTGGFEQRPTY